MTFEAIGVYLMVGLPALCGALLWWRGYPWWKALWAVAMIFGVACAAGMLLFAASRRYGIIDEMQPFLGWAGTAAIVAAVALAWRRV